MLLVRIRSYDNLLGPPHCSKEIRALEKLGNDLSCCLQELSHTQTFAFPIMCFTPSHMATQVFLFDWFLGFGCFFFYLVGGD